MTGSPALDEKALSLAKQARTYLTDEMNIAVSGWRRPAPDDGSLTLDALTAIAGIGDPSGHLAAFGFSPELAEYLFQQTILQLNIPLRDISLLEQELYRQGSLIEAANVIIGNWLPNYGNPDDTTGMTPPTLLERAKRITRFPGLGYAAVNIKTGRGELKIALIHPRSLFEKDLAVA